jgi:hypothetical protein
MTVVPEFLADGAIGGLLASCSLAVTYMLQLL